MRRFLEHIAACPPPMEDLGDDVCLWKNNDSGKFSVNKAYKSQIQVDPNTHNDVWRVIWKNILPPRINNFLWLMLKKRLLTNHERVRRRLTNDSSCILCGNCQETLIHTLRDCNIAKCIWSKTIATNDYRNFSDADLEDWMISNLKNQSDFGLGVVKWDFFAVTCLFIWKYMKYFRENMVVRTEMIVGQAETLAIHISNATATGGNWSAVGGVLRDSHGNWLVGFCRFLGRGFAITAELWGILHDLEIAWQKEYTKVIIESDNKSAVAMLIDVSIGSSSSTTLVQRIKEECRRNWTVNI
ncbi:hypothetical protein Goklo_013617 [Gossypium klotzschianum]|uniref:Reverse transcriptase zinc-binding domain-containing protein n=1 Tax=Gossypium klotzschianum TaxID=34286 RepID=A0A7J8U4W1_9ROSI|nr:hypothetical protein [Gossypium klotzschianum]